MGKITGLVFERKRPDKKPLDKMTAAELDAEGKELGIDMSGAKTKEEKLAAITAVQKG